MCMTGNLVEFKDLRIRFKQDNQQDILKGISFYVQKGEMLAIVGESGSGKTLICKTILGLLPKNAIVEGECITGKVNCSLVLQDPMTALDPAMTVGKQILEAIPNKKNKTKDRVVELLNLVGIQHAEQSIKQFPSQFSGGMRQRVAIAIAMAMEPDVLIADEPTTSLDSELADNMMQLFKNIQEQLGTTIVFITHDLSLVKKYAQRILIIEKGKIIEQGNALKIFENPENEYTKRLIYYSTFVEHNHSKKLDNTVNGSILSAKNITKSYKLGRGKIKRVLDNVNLDIYNCETLGISGRSGIGKTTLLKLLSKIEKPDKGEIQYSDVVSKGNKLQIIFQDSRSALNPRMKIRKILGEPLYIQTKKVPGDDILGELLERVELPRELMNRYPHEISGGERQRIAIARAISTKPALILADEPVSSLDVTVRSKIVHLLRKLKDEDNLTLMLISHDIPLLNHVSDRIINLE